MNCPRCAAPDVETPACPSCGIIVAKWKPAPPRVPQRLREPSSGTLGGIWLPSVGLILLVAFAAYRLKSSPPATPKPSLAEAPAPAPTPPTLALPAATLPPAPPVEALKVEAADGVPPADLATASRLGEALQARRPLSVADVSAAEDLFARYPAAPLRRLLEATLVALAGQETRARRFDQAQLHLRRAVEVSSDNPVLREALLELLLEMGDWTGAEAVARAWLGVAPRDPEALRGLAFALMRQDRNREAEEAVRASLEIREDATARTLLARLQSGMVSEKGMTEQQLAYFHVRYDGQAHEDVGREILRVLEHHRATLVRTFDHQPRTTIPVILFSSQSYYDSTGAPAWAGGHFDSLDGRIRIPIGGLTTALTPDMDGTLIHELTHAFVNDRTGGIAPRDLHEGLAQYMEGKRVASMLSPDQLRALAGGRATGVGGFYVGALSFVEFLVAERGQGGINDLLRAMAETGNVDEAYRQVYGRDAQGSLRAWRDRLRMQYGG